MSWRGLVLSEPAKVAIKQSRLSVQREGEDEIFLAVEDMAFVVLDTPRVTLTAAALSVCAAAGCLVIFSDDKHMPCGALLPCNQYYRQLETVQAQLALSLPRKKRLWREIVIRKIHNQATCLERFGRLEQAGKVASLTVKVQSGDVGNVEGHAARLYWHAYADKFIRDADGEDRLNAMLNYGYALLRSAIARELAAFGFVLSLGLNHKSLENAFNLADDIIEPWRPFVDDLVMRRWRKTPGKEFVREDRQSLCGIFYEQTFFDGGECQLLAALRRQVSKLKGWLKGEEEIAFPRFSGKIGSVRQDCAS
jgi:CRISPR-associated protein Cas1